MNQPAVSVVVCTYNRLSYLRIAFEYLRRLEYPTWELIIVNDGSTDGTREFLEELVGNSEVQQLRVIHHLNNKGLSVARNTGIAAAQYDILAFTDDDCMVTPNWLTELVRPWQEHQDIGFVIGETRYVRDNYVGYFPERLVQNIGARWPMGCNIAYHKNVFEKLSGFDSAYFRYNNEDTEMAIRAVAGGFAYQRAPLALVYHQAMDWTVSSLLRSTNNPAVWPRLITAYPNYYMEFGPQILHLKPLGRIILPMDYVYILLMPILIPILLVRYLQHGKRDVKIFFTKWPVLIILRQLKIWQSAMRLARRGY